MASLTAGVAPYTWSGFSPLKPLSASRDALAQPRDQSIEETLQGPGKHAPQLLDYNQSEDRTGFGSVTVHSIPRHT